MNKVYIGNKERFDEFCSESRVGKSIEGLPSEYPCIIVYKELFGWYDYTFI